MKSNSIRKYHSQILGLSIKISTSSLKEFIILFCFVILANSILLSTATLFTMYISNKILPLFWIGYPTISIFPALIFVSISDALIGGIYWVVLLIAFISFYVYASHIFF